MTTANKSDKDRVVIFDTTLRDGEQCPGATMTFEEKLGLPRCSTTWASTSSKPASRSLRSAISGGRGDRKERQERGDRRSGPRHSR